MVSENGRALDDGGVGGVRVEEHYRTRVLGIIGAIKTDNGRPVAERDLAIARHLVAEGRRSKFARNKLAAGRLALMIAEAERRHVRWAMGFEQKERHHSDRMTGENRRLELMESGPQSVTNILVLQIPPPRAIEAADPKVNGHCHPLP